MAKVVPGPDVGQLAPIDLAAGIDPPEIRDWTW